MCGVYVKRCVFVFALFEKGEVGESVCVFLYEFGYDSFNPSVKSGFMAEGSKKSGERPMCTVDRATLFAQQGMVGIVKRFIAPRGSVCVREASIVEVIVGTLFSSLLCIGVVFALRSRRTYGKAQAVESTDTEVQINEMKSRVCRCVFEACAVSLAGTAKKPASAADRGSVLE